MSSTRCPRSSPTSAPSTAAPTSAGWTTSSARARGRARTLSSAATPISAWAASTRLIRIAGSRSTARAATPIRRSASRSPSSELHRACGAAGDKPGRDPMKKTTRLRKLLKKKNFVYMPVAYDALGGRLLESLGFDCVYTGGFVTGGSRCTSEPMLTMDEQIRVAADVAAAVDIPLVVDGGAGFGEPLHTMRTVRECIRSGLAGTHIEDQLYPKRAHYHKYVAHAIERSEFIDKIAFASNQRDKSDPDFVIIARTDPCRSEGLKEAVARINIAAD